LAVEAAVSHVASAASAPGCAAKVSAQDR